MGVHGEVIAQELRELSALAITGREPDLDHGDVPARGHRISLDPALKPAAAWEVCHEGGDRHSSLFADLGDRLALVGRDPFQWLFARMEAGHGTVWIGRIPEYDGKHRFSLVRLVVRTSNAFLRMDTLYHIKP